MRSRTCDGIPRRDFLRAGMLGSAGLTLSNYLRWAHAGELRDGPAKAATFIHLNGGPSHLDTFDMKPDAPEEYRGTFRPIKTIVPGIQICEHLPRLALCMNKVTLLRGVTHGIADHNLGNEYVNTGTRPVASIQHPGYGAVVTRETWEPSDLPPFVAIPDNRFQRPGFLGVKYAPLSTGAAPRAGRPFEVRGISLSRGLTVTEVERRHSLLKDLDTAFRGYEQKNELLEGLDQFSEQAQDIIISPRAREAFDISQEPPSYAGKFGTTPFGLSCLLATRLIEAGVRFVTLSHGGWDTHGENFSRLETRLLPPLDEGLSALLIGLEEKGLLDSTVVFVTGEFGRTPKVNDRSNEGGRDHYPRCMFMLLAGGGVRGGQVLGESDERATEPASEGFSPDDVAATFYHCLGIDPQKEYYTDTGRPITRVRGGRIIHGVLA